MMVSESLSGRDIFWKEGQDKKWNKDKDKGQDETRGTSLKPVGEIKVASIPFGGVESYQWSIQPGNTFWGKSWAARPTRFHDNYQRQMKLQERLEKRDVAVVEDGEREKEKRNPRQYYIFIGHFLEISHM